MSADRPEPDRKIVTYCYDLTKLTSPTFIEVENKVALSFRDAEVADDRLFLYFERYNVSQFKRHRFMLTTAEDFDSAWFFYLRTFNAAPPMHLFKFTLYDAQWAEVTEGISL